MTKETNNIFSISNSYLGSKNGKSGKKGVGETPNFKIDFYKSSLNLKKTKEIEADIAKFELSPKKKVTPNLFSKKSSTNLEIALKNKLNFNKKNPISTPKALNKISIKNSSNFNIQNALKKIKSVESVGESQSPQLKHGSTFEQHFSKFEIVSNSEKDPALESGASSINPKICQNKKFSLKLTNSEQQKIQKKLIGMQEMKKKSKSNEDVQKKKENVRNIGQQSENTNKNINNLVKKVKEPESKKENVDQDNLSISGTSHQRFKKGLLSDSNISGMKTSDIVNRPTEKRVASPKSRFCGTVVNRRLKKNNTHRFENTNSQRKVIKSPNGKSTKFVNPKYDKPRIVRVICQKKTSQPTMSQSSNNSSKLKLSNLISKLPKESKFFRNSASNRQSQMDKLISSKIQKNLSNYQPINYAFKQKENGILKHKESLIPNNINLSFAKINSSMKRDPSSTKKKISVSKIRQIRKKNMKTNHSNISINTIDSVYLNNHKRESPYTTNQSNKNNTFTKYSIEEYNQLSSKSLSINADLASQKDKYLSNRSGSNMNRIVKRSVVHRPKIIKRTLRSKSVGEVWKMPYANMNTHNVRFIQNGNSFDRTSHSENQKIVKNIGEANKRKEIRILSLQNDVQKVIDKYDQNKRSAYSNLSNTSAPLIYKQRVSVLADDDSRNMSIHTPKNKSVFHKYIKQDVMINKNLDSPQKKVTRKYTFSKTSKSLPILKKTKVSGDVSPNKSAKYWNGLKIIEGPKIIRKVIRPSHPDYIKIIDANIRYGRRIPVKTRKLESEQQNVTIDKENVANLGNIRNNLKKWKSLNNQMKVIKPSIHSKTCELENTNLIKLLSDTNQSLQVNTMQYEPFPLNVMKESMHKKIKSNFKTNYKGKSYPLGKIDSEIYNSISRMSLDTITERMIDNLELLMKDPAIKEQINKAGIDERKIPLLNPQLRKERNKKKKSEKKMPTTQISNNGNFNFAVIQPNVVMNIQTGLQNVNCHCGTTCLYFKNNQKCQEEKANIARPRSLTNITNQQGFYYKAKRNASTSTDNLQKTDTFSEKLMKQYNIKQIISMVSDQISQNRENPEKETCGKIDKSIQISRVLEDLVEQNIIRCSKTSNSIKAQTVQRQTKQNESLVFESNKRVISPGEENFFLAQELNHEISEFARNAHPRPFKKNIGKRSIPLTDNKHDHPFYLKMSSHLKEYLHSDVQISDSQKYAGKNLKEQNSSIVGPQEVEEKTEEVDIQDTQIINNSIRQMGQIEVSKQTDSEYQSHINYPNSSTQHEPSFVKNSANPPSNLTNFFSSKNISEIEAQGLSKLARRTKTIEIDRNDIPAEKTERTLPHAGTSDTQFESKVKFFDFEEKLKKEDFSDRTISMSSKNMPTLTKDMTQKETANEEECETKVAKMTAEEEEKRRKEYGRITSETFNKMITFKIDNRVRHVQEGGQNTFQGISNEILKGEDMGETNKHLRKHRGNGNRVFMNNVQSMNKFNSISGETVSGRTTPRDNLNLISVNTDEKMRLKIELEEIAEKTESNCKSQKTESNSNTGKQFYSSSRKNVENAKVSKKAVQGQIKEEIHEEQKTEDKTIGTGLEEVQSGSTFFVGIKEDGEVISGNNIVSPKNEVQKSKKIGQSLSVIGQRKKGGIIRVHDTFKNLNNEEVKKDEKKENNIKKSTETKKPQTMYNLSRQFHPKNMRRNMTFGGQTILDANQIKSKSCQNSFYEEESSTKGRKRMISFKVQNPSNKKPDAHPRINIDALEGTISDSSESSEQESNNALSSQQLRFETEHESRHITNPANMTDTFDDVQSRESCPKSSQREGDETRKQEIKVNKMKAILNNIKSLDGSRKYMDSDLVSRSLANVSQKEIGWQRKNVSGVGQNRKWPIVKKVEKKLGYNPECSPKSSVFLKEFVRDNGCFGNKSKSPLRIKKKKMVVKRQKKKAKRVNSGATPIKKRTGITSSIQKLLKKTKKNFKPQNYSRISNNLEPPKPKKNTQKKQKSKIKKPNLRIHRRIQTEQAPISSLLRPTQTPKHLNKKPTTPNRIFRKKIKFQTRTPLRPPTYEQTSIQSVRSREPMSSLKSTKNENFENRNMTSLKKILVNKKGSSYMTEKKKIKKGNFTTIDELSNRMKGSLSMTGKNKNFQRRRLAKNKSTKSTLVKICRNNLSIQSSLADLKNRIKTDVKNYSSGNISTRTKLTYPLHKTQEHHEYHSNNNYQKTNQNPTPHKNPYYKPQQSQKTEMPPFELVTTLNTFKLYHEFNQILKLEILPRNSELESIREEATTINQETYSDIESSQEYVDEEKQSSFVKSSVQGHLDIYTSRGVSKQDSEEEFRQGLMKEVNSMLAYVDFEKMKLSVPEGVVSCERPLLMKEWKVHMTKSTSTPGWDSFMLKMNRKGEAVNVCEILSTAKEILKVKKNIFTTDTSYKLCSNIYISELEQKDLVLLRSSDDKGEIASKQIEIINPKSLFGYITLPQSFQESHSSRTNKPSLDRSSNKTYDSKNIENKTSNSNFYKRVVTEEYNNSRLATGEKGKNREHFSFSQIQDQKISQEKLDSNKSKKNSTAKISLRYLNRNSEDRETAIAINSNNVTSLHNSNKILKNFTSNSSKKYSLYERKNKGPLPQAFMEMLKNLEHRHTLLVDRTGMEEILIHEEWITRENSHLEMTIQMLFDYLFEESKECAVIHKFLNHKFVFVKRLMDVLEGLWQKYKRISAKFGLASDEINDEQFFEEVKSWNRLSNKQKEVLNNNQGQALLYKYFKLNGQDYLNLAALKISNQEKTTFNEFIEGENIIDDFRVFWDLIAERKNLIVEKRSIQKEKTKNEIIRKMKLTTTEKKRGKKENLKILKAELKREKRKTKMALKSLNKKIEYIMDEDAKKYLQLKENKFDKREVYLTYEELKKKEGIRNKKIKEISEKDNVFYNRESQKNPKEKNLKELGFKANFLSPKPKTSNNTSPNNSAFISRRNCKSLCKMMNNSEQNLAVDRNSYHYKYLLKKSLSLEKGKAKTRPNKWLKKPEDIGNYNKFDPKKNVKIADQRKMKDTFESDCHIGLSTGSDNIYPKKLTSPNHSKSRQRASQNNKVNIGNYFQKKLLIYPTKMP